VVENFGRDLVAERDAGNSVLPESAPQGGEDIEEAGGGLAGVPRAGAPGGGIRPAREVATPDGGVEPEGEHHRTGWAVGPPGLGMFGADVLLDVFVAALDRPPTGVAIGGVSSGCMEVGGDKEVVRLVAGGVPDYGESDEFFGVDLVPKYVTDVD